MQHAWVGVVLLTASFLSGCASIVDGRHERIKVESTADNTPVLGASCTLTNSEGRWMVRTPGWVMVTRAYGTLDVVCEKSNMTNGQLTLDSSTKPMVLTNWLTNIVPAVVGTGVDIGTGAAYDYPEKVTVRMGETGTATYRWHLIPDDGSMSQSEY